MQQLATRLANHALSPEGTLRNLGRDVDPSLLLASTSELSRLALYLKTQGAQVKCGLLSLNVEGGGQDAKTLSPTLIVETPLDKFALRLNNVATTSRARGLLEETIALTYCASSPQWISQQLESPTTEAYMSIFPRADYSLPAPCVSRVTNHASSQDHYEVVLCGHPQLRPKASAIKTVPRTAKFVTNEANSLLAIVRADGQQEFYTLKTVDAVDFDIKPQVVQGADLQAFREALRTFTE
jgi:hypothetical protein